MEPTTKKWKTEKLKVKTDMLRSIGKQSGESVESGRRKGKLRWEGFAERKVLQSARSIRLESITASGQG